MTKSKEKIGDLDLVQSVAKKDKTDLFRNELVEAQSFISNEAKFLDKKLKQEELKNLKQDRKLRENFSSKLYRLIVFWLIAIGLVLFLHGFSIFLFQLSDAVLIALITTTTANVLGLFITVTRYLFPSQENMLS